MTDFDYILSHALRDQIGEVLIHFTWQAAAIAVVAGVLLYACRVTAPYIRYAISYVSLLSMLVLPCATVFLGSSQNRASLPGSAENRDTEVVKTEVVSNGEVIGVQYRKQGSQLSEKLVLIGRVMPYVTMWWMAGVLLVSLYHLVGFARLRKLSKSAYPLINPAWQSRITTYVDTIHLKHSIDVRVSGSIETPAVLGFLKPVLLLPVSFVTGVDLKFVEVILLHELAHIRRYDYLLNLVQMIIETLGFFHPAVWWISRRIREEREECCDAVVVSITGDRLAYAKSLLFLEEQLHIPQLVMAAVGGSLFRRISRILGHVPSYRYSPLVTASSLILAVASLVILTGFVESEGTGLRMPSRQESRILIGGMESELVAYYPFDGNALDASVHGRDGIAKKLVPAEDRYGIKGRALDFDGKNASIRSSAFNTPDLSGSLTISGWIYPRRYGSYESWIAAEPKKGIARWRIGFGEKGNNEWGFSTFRYETGHSGYSDFWTYDPEIPLNQWSHIAVVADQQQHVTSMYLNGRKIVDMYGLESYDEWCCSILSFGYQSDNGVFFDGRIDDVRIYRKALNDREVYALYNLE